MAKQKSRRVRRDDVTRNLRELQDEIDTYIGVLKDIEWPMTQEQKQAGEDGLSAFEGTVDDAKGELEGLMGEVQAWRDNMPESLSNGDKAQALEDCVTQLQGGIDALDGCNFPGWQADADEDEIDTLCDELEQIKGEIDTAIDEAEGAEFPALYG